MRAYVAGRTRQFKRVREMQQHLRERGDEITFDWTSAASDEEWLAGPSEQTRTDAEMEKNAWNDVEGVEAANYVVILGDPGLVGTLIEYGIAVAMRIPIFIMGDLPRASIFDRLPLVKYISSIEHLDAELDLLADFDNPPG